MGNCKDNMTKSDTKKKKKRNSDGILGFLPRKKDKQAEIEESPRQFADVIEEADKKIGELVMQKKLELKNEAGSEEYNRKALAVLKTIQYHIDETIESMADYADLK